MTRRPRADARRNVDAVLQAAKVVFSTAGVHAPVRVIAAEAGVGPATVLRHFPQRAELVSAVFRHELDGCAEAASLLAAEYEPGEELVLWLHRYAGLLATKRGLAAAMQSQEPTYETLPSCLQEPLLPGLELLLAAAAAAGEIRGGVDPGDLLQAVACLCLPASRDPDLARRMLATYIDGLRHGATKVCPLGG